MEPASIGQMPSSSTLDGEGDASTALVNALELPLEMTSNSVTDVADQQQDGDEAEQGNEVDEAEDDDGEFLDPSLLTEATLPISNISRLMKKALPRQAKVSSSAKDLIQECCIEFISFLTSEANDKCLAEKRKTINGDDILYAMKMLSFDEYEVVCRIWLSRYRTALELANREKLGQGASSTGQGHARAGSKRALSDDAEGQDVKP